VATGIVDQLEVEVDGENGERATVNGRDLLGQLEDNSAVSIQKEPIWGQSISVEAASKKLIEGTRIQKVVLADAPSTPVLFASEPGESRLSALLRLCEPLNCMVWTSADGALTVGRPNFSERARGTLICNRRKRESNVFSMRATFSAAAIPNKVVVLWSDVQSTQQGIPPNQIFDNAAQGPSRLRKAGHNVIKTVMTSYPSGGDAQSLASAAQFQAASAANSTILQALAKRELARANFNEIIVQAVVPGHFNDQGDMYRPDQCYMIDFDRAGISEKMYLFSVEWNLSEERGQYTVLSFCRLGTMVSDARIR
jgi:prophage tail gpP-like protein